MNTVTYAKVIWQDFVSLLFPTVCINCQEILVKNEPYLCLDCRTSLPTTNFHLQNPNPFLREFTYLQTVCFASAYLHFNRRGIAQKLLHQLKYHAAYDLGRMLGQWYGLHVKPFVLDFDVLVPIPLHPSKKKMRGYNQSMALAEGISIATGIPVREDILIRTKKTKTQTKKAKLDRWKNMEGVFRVPATIDITGKRILVVDDVVTTGSTISSACLELEERGACALGILAIATGK